MDIGLALLLEALVLLNDLLDGGLFGRLSSRSCCRRDGCHLGLKGISVTVGGVLALDEQFVLSRVVDIGCDRREADGLVEDGSDLWACEH